MTKKTKFKRLPKSQRSHIRLMKQTARKEGVPYQAGFIRRVPAKPSQKSNATS